MKMVTRPLQLLAAFVSPLAMVARADFPLFGSPDRAWGGEVSLADGNPGAVNIASILNMVAYANGTHLAERLVSEKDGLNASLYLYPRKAQAGGWYHAAQPKAPNDSTEIELWSRNSTWPATIVRILHAGGEKVYDYPKVKSQPHSGKPQWVDDLKNPIRTKVQGMQIQDCLQRLFGPPTRQDVGTVAEFHDKIQGFDKDTGNLVILETKPKCAFLKPNYAYGLLSVNSTHVYLGDPARDNVPWTWLTATVVQDFKWAWRYDPGALTKLHQ